MKKAIFLTLIAVFTLSACNLFQPAEDSNAPDTATKQQESENIFTSIKDAVLGGMKLQCTFEADGHESTAYISGKKVRVDGAMYDHNTEEATGSMINDGQMLYVWNDIEKTGMKWDLSKMEEIQDGPGFDVDEWKDTEAWADEMDQDESVDCSIATFSDSKFTPPSDVEFQDLNAFMESMQEITQDFDPNQDMDKLQEQMEQLQQQYNQ